MSQHMALASSNAAGSTGVQLSVPVLPFSSSGSIPSGSAAASCSNSLLASSRTALFPQRLHHSVPDGGARGSRFSTFLACACRVLFLSFCGWRLADGCEVVVDGFDLHFPNN